MTESEKIIKLKKQKNEAQKRYYQKNKEYYQKYAKEHPTQAQKLRKRIEDAIKYINSCTWSNGVDEEIQYSLHVPTLLDILNGKIDNNK